MKPQTYCRRCVLLINVMLMVLCKTCGINPISDDRVKRRQYRCYTCDYARYKSSYLAQSRRKRASLKQLILDHYGDICAYCGSTDNLQIDHIDGNGAAHRKEMHIVAGNGTYAWLKKNGFPEGFQVLCKCCNGAK